MPTLTGFTQWIFGTSLREEARPEDFRRLYDEYRPYVWRVAYWLAGADAADDIVQETFVKIWGARFRGDCSLKTWVHRIAVNAAFDHLRRNRRHAAEEVPESMPAAGEAVDDVLAVKALIRAAIARMPETQRAAFVLYYQQEFSVEEVAECLGLAAGTVKSRLHHGRAAFVEFLRKHGVSYDGT